MSQRKRQKILIVAPEVFPQMKVGGLGQFVAGVVKSLKKKDIDVRLVTPRESVYDLPCLPATQLKFRALAQEAMNFCEQEDWRPDLVWAHDWSGIAVLKEFQNQSAKTIWTVHSPLANGYYYYGYAEEPESEPIDWSDDFFDFHGLAETGFRLADEVNTVSPAYAKEVNSKFEIRSSKWFDRLTIPSEVEGQIRNSNFQNSKQKNQIAPKIMGIANGIDFDYWNPKKDNLLAFKLKDNYWPEFKKRNKIILQQAFGLPIVDRPVFCFVSRLSPQKGIDLFFSTLPKFLGKNKAQIIVVGQGMKKYHHFFESLKNEFPFQVGLKLEADFDLPHQVFAGADFLVLPSRTEPGGIVVQEAARYGCLPIVRLTGGLKDQVKDGVSGLGFSSFSAVRLEEKLYQATNLWPREGVWRLREKARERIRSWNTITGEYLEWFDERN